MTTSADVPNVYMIQSSTNEDVILDPISYVRKSKYKPMQICLVALICLLLALLTILLMVYFFKPSASDNESDQVLRDYANYSLGTCSSYQCGQNVVHSKTLRIIGGQTVTPYTWPWQGALMKKNGFAYYLTCGATVISDQWILTAAHCFQTDTNPNNFMIKLGAFNANANDEPGEMIMKIASIFVHPKFDEKLLINDVAVLKLQHNIQCNDHIVPVCLPNQSDTMPPVGTMLTVTGWGTTKEGGGTTSSELRQVAVPLMGQLTCMLDYGLMVNYAYNFCAGYQAGGKDACQGDSGGPAVHRSNEQSPWVQLGITSWGDGCGKAGKPGVYSRVSTHIDWIKQYTTVMHA